MSKPHSTMNAELKKEEEELARAIQLSLQEANASKNKQKTSLYSTIPTNNYDSGASNKERRKVKALYDFEAAEDNEINFKAGDILFVIDETDENWWKGFDTKGNEGLFPSNFVTSDLDYQVETYEKSNSSKKVTFNDQVQQNTIDHKHTVQFTIDEKKIDDCLELLQNADPTGEIQPDTHELLELEDQCYMMGPLIDKQLQKIDHKHAILEDLNIKMLEAFQIYNNLMKDSISKTANLMGANQMVSDPMAGYPNQIPYVTAPPSADPNSFLLANQLNSMSAGNQNPGGMPSNYYQSNMPMNMSDPSNGQKAPFNMAQQQYAGQPGPMNYYPNPNENLSMGPNNPNMPIQQDAKNYLPGANNQMSHAYPNYPGKY